MINKTEVIYTIDAFCFSVLWANSNDFFFFRNTYSNGHELQNDRDVLWEDKEIYCILLSGQLQEVCCRNLKIESRPSLGFCLQCCISDP